MKKKNRTNMGLLCNNFADKFSSKLGDFYPTKMFLLIHEAITTEPWQYLHRTK